MAIGIIGFICRDTDIRKAYNEKINKIGGKAYYAGVTLSNLGVPSKIMFYTDNQSEDILKTMTLPNLKLFNINSKKTPIIINTYLDKKLERRKWKIMNNDFKYNSKMINDEIKKCEYIIICPLNPRESDIELLSYLKKNTKARLAADIDLYLSDVKENGDIIKMKNEELEKILSNLEIVIISKKDRIIEGSDEDILRYIGKQGVNEVIMTSGSEGALIYSKKEGKIYKIPAVKAEKIVDSTGAGDTFLAAYVAARYKNKSIEEAGKFAAKVASAKLKYVGALNEKINV